MKKLLIALLILSSYTTALAEKTDTSPEIGMAAETGETASTPEYETNKDEFPETGAEKDYEELLTGTPSPSINDEPTIETPDPTDDNEPVSDTVPSSDNSSDNMIVLALETESIISGGKVIDTYQQPFLYHERTYVPFDIITSALGVEVVPDIENRAFYSVYGWHKYAAYLDAPGNFIFNDMLYVPLRDLCNDMGFSVFWNDGLIAVSLSPTQLSDETTEEYKKLLSYDGHRDVYYVPAHIVNPYVTYSYQQMCEDVDYLSKAYPDLIKKFSIGMSAEGRDLTAFTLGKGEKKVIMCASMHAREYIATNFIMSMADKYAYAYVNGDNFDNYNVKELLDNVTLVIIPMVNPDGINLVQNGFEGTQNPEHLSILPTNKYGYRGWKATVNGVDLNNNFDLFWYSKGSPSYAGYSGPIAASEPETQAMQNYIMNNDFMLFASLHTQGQVVYWMDPNCDQSLVGICKPYVDRLCKEIGFTEMPSDGTIGYSGYMTDYIRYNKKKMAMTIELCPYVGDYPYPESDFDTVERPIKNLGLILADIALKITY